MRAPRFSRESGVNDGLISLARCETLPGSTLIWISWSRMVAAVRDASFSSRFLSSPNHKPRSGGGPRGGPVPLGSPCGSARGTYLFAEATADPASKWISPRRSTGDASCRCGIQRRARVLRPWLSWGSPAFITPPVAGLRESSSLPMDTSRAVAVSVGFQWQPRQRAPEVRALTAMRIATPI